MINSEIVNFDQIFKLYKNPFYIVCIRASPPSPQKLYLLFIAKLPS